MKTKRLSAILIAAILIIALACTAVAAVTLGRSARYEATRDARSLIQATYGVTPQALSLFGEVSTETDAEYITRFEPDEYKTQMGTYEVRIPKSGGTPAVTWTNDGQSLTDTGFSAAAWGQPQLETLMALKTEHLARTRAMEAKRGPIMEWSLAERAEVDAVWLPYATLAAERQLHVLPADGDIPPEAAEQRIRDALAARYGLSPATLATYAARLTLMQQPGKAAPVYTLLLYDEATTGADTGTLGIYALGQLNAQTGDISALQWHTGDTATRLPDGPLEDHPDAVREYIASGSLSAIADDDARQAMAQRIIDAGYGDLLDGIYALPSPGAMDRPAALAAAADALRTQYGLTDAMLAFFDTSADYIDGDAPGWKVLITPNEDDPAFATTFSERMGAYTVRIDANGAAATWTHDGTPIDHTGQLGEAPAWDAAWMAQFIPLHDEYAVIARRMDEANAAAGGHATAMDIRADMAAYHTLLRDAGFDRERNFTAEPGEGEIPFDTAMDLLRAALLEEYGLTAQGLDALTIAPTFSVLDPDHPVWAFSVFSQTNNDGYHVELDGRTGEIITNRYYFEGNG